MRGAGDGGPLLHAAGELGRHLVLRASSPTRRSLAATIARTADSGSSVHSVSGSATFSPTLSEPEESPRLEHHAEGRLLLALGILRALAAEAEHANLTCERRLEPDR